MAVDRIIELSLRARGFRAYTSDFGGTLVHHLEHPGRRGVGPALVFVHGIGASSTHFHDTLLRLLPTGRPIHALDLPGHGQSSELNAPVTPDALLDVLDAYLTRVVGGPFVLIGNSLGGALSVNYAWRRPERVVGVVAASPAIGFQSAEDWLELKGRLVLDTPADAERFVRSVYHRPPLALRFISRMFLRSMNRRSVRELITSVDVESLAPPEARAPLPPTLVVWGRSERVFTPRIFEGLRASLPPEVMIEEPERVGHCPHLDAPGWFAKRISTFVESLEPRPRLRAHIG